MSAEDIPPTNPQSTLIRNIIIAVIIAGIAVGVVFLIVGALIGSPTTPTHTG